MRSRGDGPEYLAPVSSGSHALVEILLTSLEALAAAGEPDAACRLAGQACAALRRGDPAAWRRFNALLHRLTKYVA
ncbi:MAG: hypothetical protein ACLPTZ_01565 [Beijerinckiaceae bacterium]